MSWNSVSPNRMSVYETKQKQTVFVVSLKRVLKISFSIIEKRMLNGTYV